MASKVLCPFFCFSTTGGERTFAVSPDLFEHAIDNDLHGPESGREIHHQLLYGNEDGGYPSYIGFPVVYRGFTGSRMCDMLDMRFDGQCFLISDKMKQLLEDERWTSFYHLSGFPLERIIRMCIGEKNNGMEAISSESIPIIWLSRHVPKTSLKRTK